MSFYNRLFGRRQFHPAADTVLAPPESLRLDIGRHRDWINGQIGPQMWFGKPYTSIMAVGKNGGGKDSRQIAKWLLGADSVSIVCFDPAGEQCAISGPHRATLGPVYAINGFDLLSGWPAYTDPITRQQVDYADMQSDGFNPLVFVPPPDDPNFSEKSGELAEAIIPMAETGDENTKHFKTGGRNMIKATIMYETILARRENRLPTMANVRSMICQDSGENPAAKTGYGWPRLVKEMQKENIEALSNCSSQFGTWSGEKASIQSVAMGETECFDDGPIAADMSKVGFDFSVLKERVATVYIIVPPLKIDRYAPYVRLILQTALNALMHVPKPGQPRCLFVLNETYSLRMPVIQKTFSQVRKYGIQYATFWQDISQLETAVGKSEMQTMIGQAGVMTFFRAPTIETAEYISKRAGDTAATLPGINQNTQPSGQASAGLSWSLVKVPTITPHDALSLGPGQQIQFHDGLANFVSAYAPPYWKVSRLKVRARRNPYAPPGSD